MADDTDRDLTQEEGDKAVDEALANSAADKARAEKATADREARESGKTSTTTATTDRDAGSSKVTLQPDSSKSVLSRAGDKGDSTFTLKPKPDEAPAPSPVPKPAPEDKPPVNTDGRIYGRTTIFHWNMDGSRDKDDPGSKGFFGANLDDKELIGAAIPVDILEAQFGKFTSRNADGTYSALDTPEAREIMQRIKSSHVEVTGADGRVVEVPIVDIQGSYKNWHRTMDLTLGAWKALGGNGDGYLGYKVVAGDGTTMTADGSWSDTSPLAKLYQKMGKRDVSSTTTDEDVMKGAKSSIAPNMPEDKYEAAMRDKDGVKIIQDYNSRPINPGQQLQNVKGGPYEGLSDEEVAKKVYSQLVDLKKIDPAKTEISEVADRLFPNPSVVHSLAEVFQPDSSFWTAVKRGASAETHQAAAQIYQIPQNLNELDKKLFGWIPGANELRDKFDGFLRQNLGGHNPFLDGAAYIKSLGDAQAKQAEADKQRQAQASKTVPGKVGGVVGGTAAGLATSAPILVPGAETKTAVALMAAYEGLSRYGQAAQQGRSDALLQGIEGAGMGALLRYMMDAPNGRLMTGFITWLANTGEDSLSRMVKGEKVDAIDFFTKSAIDIISGVFMGHAKEGPRKGKIAGEVVEGEEHQAAVDQATKEQRAAVASQVLGPETSEEYVWHAPSPLVSRYRERSVFTPQELTLASGTLPSGASPAEMGRRAGLLQPPLEEESREVHLADPEAGLKEERNKIIRAEVKAAAIAKENGDLKKSQDHINRALSLHDGVEQKKIGQEVIDFSNKWADGGGPIGKEPEIKLNDTDRAILNNLTGFGNVELVEDRPLDIPTELESHLGANGLERNGEAKRNTPESEVATGTGLKQMGGQMGAAISKNMRDMLWGKFEKGVTTEAGAPSNLLILAARGKAAGRITTREDFESYLNRYGESLKNKQPINEFAKSEAARIQTGQVQQPAVESIPPEATGAAPVSAEFHSGIVPDTLIKGIKGTMKWAGETETGARFKEDWREVVSPEKHGPGARTMADLVKARRSGVEEMRAELPKELAHAERLEKVLHGGEKVAVRRGFFSRIAQANQREMLIAHEKGLSSGHPVADALFKFHDSAYAAMEKLEKKYGFKYEAVESYIYHWLKGGQAERARFKQYHDHLVAADPTFTHRRKFLSIEELEKHGFKLKSYNPEDILQARLFQSAMAINKVMVLRDAERAGIAYNVNRPGLGKGITEAWGEPVRAPNGERYHVRPDSQKVLHNAWDRSSLYDLPLIGPVAKAAVNLKGLSVPLKLGWSAVHARHIAMKMNVVSFLTTLTRADIHNNLRGDVFTKELNRLLKVGYAHSAEVQVLQGKRLYSTLSAEQKANIAHFNGAGLSATVSDEMQTGFADSLHQEMSNQMERLQVPRGAREKVHGAATLLQSGYDILSSGVMQNYLFHTLIPQIKFSAFLGIRDNILREHPEFLKPENEFKFRKELTDAGHQIEARFGEMFYDNLLWKGVAKDIGKSTLLSFGWQLGAVRIYAGALHDFSVLGSKLMTDWKKINRNDLSDRMIFATWYTALNMVEAATMTTIGMSIWNMQHPNQKQDVRPEGMDYVFPRTWVDERGRAKRVAPVEYSREIATLWQHIQSEGVMPGTLHMMENKLSPVLSTLIQEFQNKNYYGQQIYDPNDPWMKQVQDAVKYAFEGSFEPISLSAAPGIGQKTGKDQSWWDTALAFMGFPPAAAWTGRTSTENRINDTYRRMFPSYGKEDEAGVAKGKAYEELRQASKARDRTGIMKAEKTLKDLQVSPSTITYIHNHPDESLAGHQFKRIPPDEQLKLLKEMNPEELKEYWPLAHKALRDKYHNDAAAALHAQ